MRNMPVFIEHSPDYRKSSPVFIGFCIGVLRFSCVFAHWHAPCPIISIQLGEPCSGFHVFSHIGMRRVPFFPGNWASDAPVFMCFCTLVCTASYFLQAIGRAMLQCPGRIINYLIIGVLTISGGNALVDEVR